MQTQFKWTALIAGVSFLLFAGFKNAEQASTRLPGDVQQVKLLTISHPTPVTITAIFTGGTFPVLTGYFTTSGALDITGDAEMTIGPKAGGKVAHCIVELTTPEGTITIRQECEFSTDPARGSWQIVEGTGAYEDLKGNGSLLMPPNTEAMTGKIY